MSPVQFPRHSVLTPENPKPETRLFWVLGPGVRFQAEYSVALLFRVVSTSRSRSPATEILFQHLLLLLASFVFLFFNPYP